MSELVVFGQGSTGAANDLAKATELATKMVREFGLSEKVGPVGYPSGGSVFLGGGGNALSSRPFAEQTQAAVDGEVARLLREAEHQAVGVLTEHRSSLDQLVELLLTNETVDGSEVYAIAGRTEPEIGAGMTLAPERASPAPPHERATRPSKRPGAGVPAKARAEATGEENQSRHPSG